MSQPVQIDLGDDPFGNDRFAHLEDSLVALPGLGRVPAGEDMLLRPVINAPGGVVIPGRFDPAGITDGCTNSCATCSCSCGCTELDGF
jgi:hypothetical protein